MSADPVDPVDRAEEAGLVSRRPSTANGGKPPFPVDKASEEAASIAHARTLSDQPDDGAGVPAAQSPDSADPTSADATSADPTRGDLTRAALADAQRMTRSPRGGDAGPARAGGSRDRLPGTGPGAAARRRLRRQNLAGRGAGGYSGAFPDATDPQPIGGLLAGYVSDRGWDGPLAEARLFADWAGVVGTDVASHCVPSTLQNGELRLSAESTAWATQLRLLTATILSRLAAELGPEVVRSVRVTGPTAPSWKHGGFSVRGARGPRDTYG